MDKAIFSVGLVLAWLVTPESLVIVTRGSGMGGLMFIGALICGGLLALANTMVIHNPKLVSAGYDQDLLVLAGGFGRVVALVTLFSGRIPILLLAATGMLVSAGFVFNEIFVYWFPNFLFAFLLLALLTIFQLFAHKYVLGFQNALVLLAVSGLLLLGVLGVFAQPAASQSYSGVAGSFSLILIGMGCIPFLGFDFPRQAERRLVMLSITGGMVLLVIWSLLAMKMVDPARLTESAVAHRSIARAVAGEQGGYLIGMVVICGVLAGCNALLHINRQIFSDLLKAGFLPSPFSRYMWLPIVILAAMIGIMMFSGLAGDIMLETQIRAAVILWFGYLGLRSVAAAHLSEFSSLFIRTLAYLPGVLTIFIGGLLMLNNPQMTSLLFLVLGVVAGALLLALTILVGHGRHLPYNQLPRRKKK